uniref:MAM domain-containing protein n=1 Tax=Knipowitschia caucasica TaxID=637954 RepID=A0AAV2MAI5_KNICA
MDNRLPAKQSSTDISRDLLKLHLRCAGNSSPSHRVAKRDMAPSSFMHASTGFGREGESAWLETGRMTLRRSCHAQCLQFYYFHSGNESDQLNIWIREFDDEDDLTGHSKMVGQITGGSFGKSPGGFPSHQWAAQCWKSSLAPFTTTTPEQTTNDSIFGSAPGFVPSFLLTLLSIAIVFPLFH